MASQSVISESPLVLSQATPIDIPHWRFTLPPLAGGNGRERHNLEAETQCHNEPLLLTVTTWYPLDIEIIENTLLNPTHQEIYLQLCSSSSTMLGTQ